MSELAALANSPLLAGLSVRELDAVARIARPRTFAAGERLCAAGDASERCWLLTAGLVHVVGGDGGSQILARHRKGASIGDVAALTGEPYAETVLASIPTGTLELRAEDLLEITRSHPRILLNVLRGAHGRLAHARARRGERDIGETVAVAADGLGEALLEAARAATPRSVASLDRRFSFAGAVTAADDLVGDHATVLLRADLDPASLEAHMHEADRVVALASGGEAARLLGSLRRPAGARADVEVVLAGPEAASESARWDAGAPLRVVHRCEVLDDGRLPPRALAWLARHLTRTKLGLALGAGGAKGYAHIGVLQVLEDAGYVVDCVAGSSIGAIVASLLALGDDAHAIETKLREAFDAKAVAEIFRTSLGGRGGGLELMLELLREITGERTFADTEIPLTVMAVDLDARVPAPLRSGAIWEALAAATALAGVFPPREREGHRLVDGLALMPVPTAPLEDDGADLTVAVNLIGREVLDRWPGGPPPDPPPERRRRGVLDNLLEVMDLSQLAESVRNAELADVAITPRFGPGEWRDFHLADNFLQAGRRAAEDALPTLGSLALPTEGGRRIHTRGGGL